MAAGSHKKLSNRTNPKHPKGFGKVLVVSVREIKTQNTTWLLLRPKPPRPPAIRLILLAKILAKPLLLTAYLEEHDDNECDEHQQRLPTPQQDADTGVIDEASRQHGVAAQAVGAIRHQVLRAGCYLMPEGIHRVAVAFAPHVDDAPHTERQPEHREHNGYHHPPNRNSTKVRSTRGQPHQGWDKEHEHQAAEDIADAILQSESGPSSIDNQTANHRYHPRSRHRA